MTRSDAVELGRRLFAERAWQDAHAQLSAADRSSTLDVEDLERLATVAYLVGRDVDSQDAWERAHHACLQQGDAVRAARCAFWLALALLLRGETARAGGWLTRAGRLLDDGGHDCPEQGYLLVPVALQSIAEGDAAAAHDTFRRVVEIGARFGDRDLEAFGRTGRGQALIRLGESAQAAVLFDEGMVAVTAGELSPIVAGIVYCAVIEACQEAFDLGRAREWTAALGHWCAAQPDLVPYRGACLVHRAEIMQLHGAWPDAVDAAHEACRRLAPHAEQPEADLTGSHPAAGAAYYQRAELHRLSGDLAEAERAYLLANQWGFEPQPGLALLRLAQGRLGMASGAIRRVLDEASDRVDRARLLAAYVEIVLATGDVSAARTAADELSEIADLFDAPLLRATAAEATGAVLLAEGTPRAALTVLRPAWTAWQALEVPYEAARVRVLIARACRELGDADSAEMELDAARWVFGRLGALPDLATVESLSGRAAPPTGGLTAREVQVLGLVAAGLTNRSIANDLFLSEKTVARHVANIFTKLGLSSRSAATAYAYQHGMV